MNPAFWCGKRVFLTGHTGFKGSWLSLWLEQLGAEVTGYGLAPHTSPNLFTAANVDHGIRSVIADVRDAEKLTKAMRDAKPDIVLHMAAQSLVRNSYQAPIETYAVNIMGTVHLLEAVRKTDSVRAVVNVTSDKCYENREWHWAYRENDPVGGHDPYSSSKGCAELVTAAYRNSFFSLPGSEKEKVAVASARAGNVIGGGDWAADRLIPDIMRALQTGQCVKIRNPNAIRPWQHVLEPLRGYLVLAELLHTQGSAYADSWNFGPADEDAKSVQWVIQYCVRRWGDGASWDIDQGMHPHEAQYLKLDCSKAKAKLNWFPRWNLATALDGAVAWYKAFYEHADMKSFTLRQISDYERIRD